MNKEKWDLDRFEYFIVTSDAVVGVFYENEEVVEGFVLVSKVGSIYGRKVKFDKNKVVKSLHGDRIAIIEQIGKWWLNGKPQKRNIDKYL